MYCTCGEGFERRVTAFFAPVVLWRAENDEGIIGVPRIRRLRHHSVALSRRRACLSSIFNRDVGRRRHGFCVLFGCTLILWRVDQYYGACHSLCTTPSYSLLVGRSVCAPRMEHFLVDVPEHSLSAFEKELLETT